MLRASILILFLASFFVSAETVPKKIQGQYQAEVPGFEFEDNNRTIKTAPYQVTLTLKEDYLWYLCGSIKFYGTYTSVVEKDNIINVKVNISNDMSINFDMDLSVDKKSRSLIISGLKGVPITELPKRDIILKKLDK